MGREKDSMYLSLADGGNNPLPADEFFLLEQPNFSVAFEEIKIVDRKGFIIPGLKTQEMKITEKFLQQKNVFSIKIYYEPEDQFGLTESRYVVKGRTTIGDVSVMVHNDLELNPLQQLEFYAVGGVNIIPNDVMLLNLYKESLSVDGFVELICRCTGADLANNEGVQVPENHGGVIGIDDAEN